MKDLNNHVLPEELDVTLYHPNATPVLTYPEWRKPLNNDGTIPKFLTLPLMLDFELLHWHTSEAGGTSDNMRRYILGTSHGNVWPHYVG